MPYNKNYNTNIKPNTKSFFNTDLFGTGNAPDSARSRLEKMEELIANATERDLENPEFVEKIKKLRIDDIDPDDPSLNNPNVPPKVLLVIALAFISCMVVPFIPLVLPTIVQGLKSGFTYIFDNKNTPANISAYRKKITEQIENQDEKEFSKFLDKEEINTRNVDLFIEKIIKLDSPDLIAQFLGYGIGINEKFGKDENTLLCYAAKKNSPKSIDFLLSKGADITIKNQPGYSVLHFAAINGNIGLAKLALKSGINIDKAVTQNLSPLYFALKNERKEMTIFLVESGADTYSNYSLKYMVQEQGFTDYFKTGVLPAWYTTPAKATREEIEAYKSACLCIKNGKISELNELVNQGLDLSKITMNSIPGVCWAVKFNKIEVLKYFLHMCDCKNLIEPKTRKNALHFALEDNNQDMAKLLLENGFDPNQQDLFDNTPLHYSVSDPYSIIPALLIEKGADISAPNMKGQTPLHLAIKKNNIVCTDFILKHGAKLLSRDRLGNTALHYAAVYANKRNMLDVLYKYMSPTDLNAKNEAGQTPRNIDSNYDHFKYYEEHYGVHRNLTDNK